MKDNPLATFVCLLTIPTLLYMTPNKEIIAAIWNAACEFMTALGTQWLKLDSGQKIAVFIITLCLINAMSSNTQQQKAASA